jgi:hypothetical protein
MALDPGSGRPEATKPLTFLLGRLFFCPFFLRKKKGQKINKTDWIINWRNTLLDITTKPIPNPSKGGNMRTTSFCQSETYKHNLKT